MHVDDIKQPMEIVVPKKRDIRRNKKLDRRYVIIKITKKNIYKIFEYIWLHETHWNPHLVPVGLGEIMLPHEDKTQTIPVLISPFWKGGGHAILGRPGDYVWIVDWFQPCIILKKNEVRKLITTDDPEYEKELFKRKYLEWCGNIDPDRRKP